MSDSVIASNFQAEAEGISAADLLRIWTKKYKKQHYGTAEAFARAALIIHPGDAGLLNALGRTLRTKKTSEDDAEALRLFEEANKTDPSNVAFLVDHVNFRRMFDLKEGNELMLAKAYMHHKNPANRMSILWTIGSIYKHDRPAWAMACFHHCLGIDPGYKRAQQEIEKLKQKDSRTSYQPSAWHGLLNHMQALIANDAAANPAPSDLMKLEQS